MAPRKRRKRQKRRPQTEEASVIDTVTQNPKAESNNKKDEPQETSKVLRSHNHDFSSDISDDLYDRTQDSDHLSKLSLEVLCNIMKFLHVRDILKLDHQNRKLHQAVIMHLRIKKMLDFSEGELISWISNRLSDSSLIHLFRRCHDLQYIYGFNPPFLSKRRQRGAKKLSIPGIIEALALLKNLKGIEVSDTLVLETLFSFFPHVEILGTFRNRDGCFPVDDLNILHIPENPYITSMHLIGIVVPKLPAMLHLKHLQLRYVHFINPHPFKDFAVPMLRTFVMANCAGPFNVLKYVPLIAGLAAARSLQRMELIRVPFLGDLLHHVVEESQRIHRFKNLHTMKFGACKHVIVMDVGFLAIASAENLEELYIQASLTKDNLFIALKMAEVKFPVFERLSLGYVEPFQESANWTNQDLVIQGLSNVTESPSTITDVGLAAVGECFSKLKYLEIYNSPHLLKPTTWIPQGLNTYEHLRELVLRRCHSVRLQHFCQFIPMLKNLEAIHLELMFKEPPKGCSRVGLSAGTGFGMSSSLIPDEAVPQNIVMPNQNGVNNNGLPNENVNNNLNVSNENGVNNNELPNENVNINLNVSNQNPQNKDDNVNEEEASFSNCGNNEPSTSNQNESKNTEICNSLSIDQIPNNSTNSSANNPIIEQGSENLSDQDGMFKLHDEIEKSSLSEKELHDISLPSTSRACQKELKHKGENTDISISLDHLHSIPAMSNTEINCGEIDNIENNSSNDAKRGNRSLRSNSRLIKEETSIFSDKKCSESKVKMESSPMTQKSQFSTSEERNLKKDNLCFNENNSKAGSSSNMQCSHNAPLNNANCNIKYDDQKYCNLICSHNSTHNTNIISQRPLKLDYDNLNSSRNSEVLQSRNSSVLEEKVFRSSSDNACQISEVCSSGSNLSAPCAQNRDVASEESRVEVSKEEVLGTGSKDDNDIFNADPTGSSANTSGACNYVRTRRGKSLYGKKKGLVRKGQNKGQDETVLSRDQGQGQSTTIEQNYQGHNETVLSRDQGQGQSTTIEQNCQGHQKETTSTNGKNDLSYSKIDQSSRDLLDPSTLSPNETTKNSNSSRMTSDDRAHIQPTPYYKKEHIAEGVENLYDYEPPITRSQRREQGKEKEEATISRKRKCTSLDGNNLTKKKVKSQKGQAEIKVMSDKWCQANVNDIRQFSSTGRSETLNTSGSGGYTKLVQKKRSRTVMCTKSTSTSDPVMEDDHIQILTLRSKSLMCITLNMVGITDLVIEDCPKLDKISGHACRVLKNVSVGNATKLSKVNFTQCKKLDEVGMVKQIGELRSERNRIVFLRPMNHFDGTSMERNLFSGKFVDYNICVIYDHSPEPLETLYNRVRVQSWQYLLSAMNAELLKKYGYKERGYIDSPTYPWSREIYRQTGYNNNSSRWELITDIPWLRPLYEGPDIDLKGQGVNNPDDGRAGIYCPGAKGHNTIDDCIAECLPNIVDGLSVGMPLCLYSVIVYVNLCDIQGKPAFDPYV